MQTLGDECLAAHKEREKTLLQCLQATDKRKKGQALDEPYPFGRFLRYGKRSGGKPPFRGERGCNL
jgi:hypothetical protein